MISCGGGDDDNGGNSVPAGPITLSAESFDFSSEGGDASVSFTAPGEWDAVASEAWIRLTKSNTLSKEGKVDIKIEPNSARDDRTGMITVLSGSARAQVKIMNLSGTTSSPATS